MNIIDSFSKKCAAAGIMGIVLFTSCKKDGNPNNLPEVSPSDYQGRVDGFTSSDEIYPGNLVAYWPFDGSVNETKSAAAPTTAVNNSFIPGGVKGQGLRLAAGYLYYATQLPAFRTDSLKSFTISSWVQILNNGSKRTILFQLARPGIFNGSINFALNTNSFPASNVDNLKIQPTFTTIAGSMQDNINTQRDQPGQANYIPYITPTIGMDKWVHLVIKYNSSNGFFDIWSNGIKAGAFPSRGTGNNLFKAYEPGEIIIGANYNSIPGKEVSADVSFAPMTGNIDEIRVFNVALPDAFIRALYNLGLAKL